MISLRLSVIWLFVASQSFLSPVAMSETPQNITVFVSSSVESVDPHHAVSFAEHAVVNTLHIGLTEYGEDGQLRPGLAKNWVVSEDGLTYTFTLEKDLTWFDGQRFIAMDVVAGIRRALDPDRVSPFAAKLFSIIAAEAYALGQITENDVLGVAALDDETVVFSLSRRDHTFLHVLAHPVAKPAPVNTPELVATGQVTSGPYRVVDDGDITRLISRDKTRTLIFEVVESAQEAWSRSEDGGPFVTAEVPIISTPSGGARASYIKPSGGEQLYAYAVNMARAPLESLEIRHALAMSIDRAAILESLGVSGVATATQYVPKTAMTYNASYKVPFASLTFEEREAVAAALLSEHGYGLSNRLALRLRIPLGDVHADVARRIAEMWAIAGIDTEIIAAPFSEHWQALEQGDFDAAFAAWPGARDTPRAFLEPLSQFGGPWNFPQYQFPGFSERLIRAAEVRDEDPRAGQYREAEKALIEDQSLLALFFYKPATFVSSRLQGWQTNPAGIHPLHTLRVVEERKVLGLSPPALPNTAP
ncbi:MAG: peptide ABC transporter substrate-binding protein [Rhodospirillaceae bacterium]